MQSFAALHTKLEPQFSACALPAEGVFAHHQSPESVVVGIHTT